MTRLGFIAHPSITQAWIINCDDKNKSCPPSCPALSFANYALRVHTLSLHENDARHVRYWDKNFNKGSFTIWLIFYAKSVPFIFYFIWGYYIALTWLVCETMVEVLYCSWAECKMREQMPILFTGFPWKESIKNDTLQMSSRGLPFYLKFNFFFFAKLIVIWQGFDEWDKER